MTMPQGASGLNVNAWLQDFQENPLPPPDTWIGEFINSADLSTLHERSRIGMEDHYKDKLTGEGGVIPGLLSFLANFGLTLPEWLSPLEDLLVWLGGVLTDTAQPLFESLLTLFDFLNTNIGVPLMEQIGEFLGWLFELFSGSIDSLLRPAFEFLKWLMDLFSDEVDGILKPILEFAKWLLELFGDSVETLLKPIFEFVKWLFTLFDGAVDTLLEPAAEFIKWLFTLFDGAIDTLLMPASEFIKWLFELLGDSVGTILEPAAQFVQWLFGLFSGADIENLLHPFFEFGKWLFTLFDGAVESLLEPAFEWLKWLMTEFGDDLGDFLQPIFEWLNWLYSTVFSGNINDGLRTLLQNSFNLLSYIFTEFSGGINSLLYPLVDFGKMLMSLFQGSVDTVLEPAFQFLQWLFSIFNVDAVQEVFTTLMTLASTFGNLTSWVNNIPSPDDLLGVIQSITGFAVETIAEGFARLIDWAQDIPLIGPIISGLMGNWKNPATGTNDTFADLVAWATNQLGLDSLIPSINLDGFIPPELVSLIPVGHVGNAQPNLVTDQGFASAATVQAGNGWSWDGQSNTPGSSGGSAKATCSGGVNQLFSNLVAVAPGQKLDLSVMARWTKTTAISASSPLISVGIRAYDGATVKYTQSLGSRTATGTSGGWVAVAGTHTVPAVTASMNVTHVRMVLSVTNGPVGAVVWFDDAVMKKTALLPEALVNGLPGNLASLLPKLNFNELVNAVAKKTGATVADVQATVNGFLNGDSKLNGGNINSGNISSAVIKELTDTWNRIVFGVNGVPPAADTLVGAGSELRNFSVAMANQGSKIQEALGQISALRNATSGLTTQLNATQKSINDLQKKANTPVTVLPPAPVIVSVTDDFERSSLGANWVVSIRNSNGSSLGIPNGHDAQFSNPLVATTISTATAIFNGTGKASNSQYQRVYSTLGSKGGVPALGTSGFNDLIGRAQSGQTCIVCRVYANGAVKFFYRLNGFETDPFNPSNTFGNFTISPQPSTGTLVEVFFGDKSAADQTRCFAKIGTAVVGPAFISSTILSSMGLGWGFGMGHGLSFAAPQRAAVINYWAGQDQV